MTDSAKAPSKGALAAAKAIEGHNGAHHACVAKMIDRETKAGEMADFLRLVMAAEAATDFPQGLAIVVSKLADEAERLLTELEGKL